MPATDAYDIAIIGAGAAGVAAGWSAARTARERGRSIRIALLDQGTHVGGTVSAALHRSLCGLYANHSDDPRDTLNAGAPRALVDALLAHEPQAVRTRRFGNATGLEFPPAAWPAALAGLCGDPQIDRQIGVRIATVDRSEDFLHAVRTADGRTIRAAAFIDATGTGQLISLVGDDVARPLDAIRPLGGFAVRLRNIGGNLEALRLAIPFALARVALQTDEGPKTANSLPATARFTTFYPGPDPEQGVLKLALPADGDGPALADQIMDILRQSVPQMATAIELERSPAVQPRDGRRLIGQETLHDDAVLAGRRCDGEVALGWWPIEWWSSEGPTYEFAPPGRPYGITAGMLRSAAVQNVFAAGSCLSATARAAASARVSGICLATGDAAGRLAAQQLASLA